MSRRSRRRIETPCFNPVIAMTAGYAVIRSLDVVSARGLQGSTCVDVCKEVKTGSRRRGKILSDWRSE